MYMFVFGVWMCVGGSLSPWCACVTLCIVRALLLENL